MDTTEYKAQANGREYTVRIFSDESACTFDQPINQKTGKGWQASKNDEVFHGERAKVRALNHWRKQVRG